MISDSCWYAESVQVFFLASLNGFLPGTEEFGGLPSMGSHRVGHN